EEAGVIRRLGVPGEVRQDRLVEAVFAPEFAQDRQRLRGGQFAHEVDQLGVPGKAFVLRARQEPLGRRRAVEALYTAEDRVVGLAEVAVSQDCRAERRVALRQA